MIIQDNHGNIMVFNTKNLMKVDITQILILQYIYQILFAFYSLINPKISCLMNYNREICLNMECGKFYYMCAIQGLAPKKQVKKHTNIYLKNIKIGNIKFLYLYIRNIHFQFYCDITASWTRKALYHVVTSQQRHINSTILFSYT